MKPKTEQDVTASQWRRYWREEKRLAKMAPQDRLAYLEANYAYVLRYSVLQEIHKLTSLVSGWKMSLPKTMLSQSKKVHGLMLNLERIKE